MNSKNINTVKLPADEKLLLDIQRREKAILDERSAINFAENTGIASSKRFIIWAILFSILLIFKMFI